MSLTYRAQFTWSYGQMLSTKSDLSYNYNLYQVKNYFVELVINKQNCQVEKAEAFVDTDYLMKYVDFVFLNKLLET
ncbi:MAG: hypothetical protein ACLFQ0_00465 [Cyclobacteriaceae bacterium]